MIAQPEVNPLKHELVVARGANELGRSLIRERGAEARGGQDGARFDEELSIQEHTVWPPSGVDRMRITYSATELKPTMKKSKIETMILVHTVSMFSGYMGPRASKTSFTA